MRTPQDLTVTVFFKLCKTARLNAEVLQRPRLSADLDSLIRRAHMGSQSSCSELRCTWPAFKPMLVDYGIRNSNDFASAAGRLLRERLNLQVKRAEAQFPPRKNPILRTAIRCHKASWYDAWTNEVWKRRGRPTFGKRIIDGVEAGMPSLRTNGKKGWKCVILHRTVGLTRVRDASGKSKLHFAVAG